MTSLLHKWDFLCSWKIDINAVFDDVSPGGMGAPQQPGVLTASPATLHKSPATVPLAGGPRVQAGRNLALPQLSE